MKKGTVTGEVKRILKDLGVYYGIVFSDKYGEDNLKKVRELVEASSLSFCLYLGINN
jgi:ribosomal protein S17E